MKRFFPLAAAVGLAAATMSEVAFGFTLPSGDVSRVNREPGSLPRDSIDRLRQQADSFEASAADLAARIQAIEAGGGAAADLRKLLRQSVGAAFNARQALQQVQVTARREQLGRIERSIHAHDQSKSGLIEHRIEEIIGSRVQGESEERPETSRQVSAADATLPDRELRDARKRRAVDIAATYLSDAKARDSQSLQGVKAVLREALIDVFETRQQLLKEELESLRRRLDWIESEIAHREAVVDEIVDRRVEELLNGRGREAKERPADTETAGDKAPIADKADPFGHRRSGDGGGIPLGRSPSRFLDRSPQDAGRFGAGLATSADVAMAEAELSEAERHFNQMEPLARKQYVSQSELNVARRLVEAARARLQKVRREYEAQKTLLQLDVESAKLKVNAARAALDAVAESYRAGDGPPPTEQQFALQEAKLELKRAETLLNLHTADQGEPKTDEEALELEAPEQKAVPSAADTEGAEAMIWRVFGARVRAMSKVGMPGDRYNGGLMIRGVRQNGPAAKAGLQNGDIIIGVSQWETISPANLLFALKSGETAGDSESEGRTVKVLFLRKAEPR